MYLALGVLAVVIVLAAVTAFGYHAAPSSSTTIPAAVQSGQTNSSQSQLFSASRYYDSAYQISNGSALSPQGRVAASDFNLTSKQLQNGSAQYTIAFVDSTAVYNVTIQNGQKLYFIDSNLADDGVGSDKSSGDDGYAIVNASGYIVAMKYPLPGT